MGSQANKQGNRLVVRDGKGLYNVSPAPFVCIRGIEQLLNSREGLVGADMGEGPHQVTGYRTLVGPC